MGGFEFPLGISKKVKVDELNDARLNYYHDQLHILWKKLLEGYKFDWSFVELYLIHTEIVKEMGRRELPHLAPINELDFIVVG